jgi:protein-tyrosine kinase
MDHIAQAVELTRATRLKEHAAERPPAALAPAPVSEIPNGHRARDPRVSDAEVSLVKLEEIRAVAHDPADPRAKSFDLLRTHVLQAMDSNGWSVLGVTSPTPGCGKTFTAINLALSISRQPESSALLVDLDLKKPQLASRLGISSKAGIRTLLEGRSSVYDSITRVAIGGIGFGVLACERSSSRSSDWLASSGMKSMFDRLRSDGEYKTIILDLPPMLASDDVLATLPHVDCVLMVASAGVTKSSELTACATQLGSTPVVRVVLNRVPFRPTAYGGY